VCIYWELWLEWLKPGIWTNFFIAKPLTNPRRNCKCKKHWAWFASLLPLNRKQAVILIHVFEFLNLSICWILKELSDAHETSVAFAFSILCATQKNALSTDCSENLAYKIDIDQYNGYCVRVLVGTKYCKLRLCATSRMVTDSSSDEVSEFFSLPNPISSTMALEFTQPVTELNARRYFCG
jgi:hypothetical protein